MNEPPRPVEDLAWEPARARAFGERMLDLYGALLADVADGPVSPSVTPETVRAAVAMDVPDLPLADDALTAHLQAILDHSLRAANGGFLAYISGAGTVPGALVEAEVELQLVRWMAARCGLPPTAGGQLVAGGSLANLRAIKIARDQALEGVRTTGVGTANARIYASAETHFTIARTADVVGLGAGCVTSIAVDDRLRMVPEALDHRLERDRAAGVAPVAIVASAGATGTGAIEPLAELADVAARHRTWFHVDAAYGGGAIISDRLRPLLDGIERADSITIDAHKWLYAPAVSAFALVRDASFLRRSFSASASYVLQERDVAERGVDLGYEGLQLSRGFTALRVWVALLAHGRAAIAARLEHDVALAAWLARAVEAHANMELGCAPSLSICC